VVAALLAALVVGALAGALAIRVPLEEAAAPAAPGPATAADPAAAAGREVAAPAADALPAARAVAGVAGPGAPEEQTALGAAPAPTAPAPPTPARALERLLDGLQRVEEGLRRVQARVRVLERDAAGATLPAAPPESDPPPAQTPADRRAALRTAGVAEEVAAEIVWLQGQQELGRLELRDQALREGWFGTDRYRAELERLAEQEPDLRDELGDEAYDRYLYAAGENNRIRVEGVIAGSVAEEIGLQPGDLIETYDGARVFSFGELRRATTEGTRDELVDIRIRRADGSIVQSLVPRGPLGVRLDGDRARPEG
jgi:membrane-associated protease RseP (regulator of RpoE activity)